jgi:hypothetical protein
VPYFISNSTILQYEQQSNIRISLIEIITTYFESKNQTTKLYFKVLPLPEDDDSSESSIIHKRRRSNINDDRMA